MTTSEPRALLIDFDGVLRRWPDVPDWPRALGITEAGIRSIAFMPALLQSVVEGSITDDAWRLAIVARLARSHARARSKRAVDLWSRSAGVLVPEVIELLDRLPANCRIVLATNATSRLPRDIEALGLSHRFHAIANSSQLRVAKPDPGFFQSALALAGVAPRQALFVDDTLENVDSASALGIVSHHFRSPDLMKAFLERHDMATNRKPEPRLDAS